MLYATAIRTSFIDFRTHRRSIAYLSVLLVVATALGIGVLTWLILPVGFAVAFAFGAVVAPPDAVAASSIARRVGLPRRLQSILEGESLVNDATAITCLRVAILAMGTSVTAPQVAGGFAIAAIGGVAVGLLVVVVVLPIRRRITDPVFDTAISFTVPYAAYLPAEALAVGGFHGSGVIAVVTAGLLLAHKSPVIQTGRSRLNERVNWRTIQFLLENVVFLLIGLQARRLIEAMSESELSAGRIAAFSLAALFGVMVLRLGWVAAARWFLFKRDSDTGAPPPWSNAVVIGWSGLRGVVTLAAAFVIPVDTPHRDTLIFGALVVTAGTLLLQGLTLPGLVRRLGMRGPDPRADALQAATVLQSSTGAALAAIDDIVTPTDAPETVQLLRDRIAARPEGLWERLGSRTDVETPADQYRRLRLETLAVERAEVLKIRDTGAIDQAVIAEVLAAFDVEESMLALATERSTELDDRPLATPADPVGSCEHLDAAPAEVAPVGPGNCQDCVAEGTRTVHLRLCLACGNVGCCDSSVGRHAQRHFRNSHHPVMRSYEPGESWRWCYVDDRLG